MEIKPEKKRGRKLGFLWLLLAVNLVLIFGIWQYHRLLVEISDGATAGLYQRILGRGASDGGTLQGKALRVAVLRSEATALSFGADREGYYNLIELWQAFLEREGFGYEVVESVPVGEEQDRFNLLLLPAARSLREQDRRAVKAFLGAGKGVMMTWAVGTRDAFGQWQRYSLLQEVAGIELAPSPPVRAEDDVSTVLLSGGYPLTATLYPGIRLRITAFDQPVAGIAREQRTQIDGVWIDPDDSSYALHSLRERVALAHGSYFGGRFAWMGFTIGSPQLTPQQQSSFAAMLRSSLLWTGNQVHAFKPVWPNARRSLASLSLNVEGPEDVPAEWLALVRRHQIPLASFVHPRVLQEHPDLVQALAAVGEVGVLLDREGGYAGRTMQEQRKEFVRSGLAFEAITGRKPVGLRLPAGIAYNESTLDAAVRAGYFYVSTSDMDRLVPSLVRSYRSIPILTRPRSLWLVPHLPLEGIARENRSGEQALMAHFSQVAALGGFYCLAIQPSRTKEGLLQDLEVLLDLMARVGVPLQTIRAATEIWQEWDHIKISVRHLSEDRASLRISNTWTEKVKDIVVFIEMPHRQPDLELESMTLGTRLPDRLTASGVRWRLHLDALGAGKNVAYYMHVDRSKAGTATPSMLPFVEPEVEVEVPVDVW